MSEHVSCRGRVEWCARADLKLPAPRSGGRPESPDRRQILHAGNFSRNFPAPRRLVSDVSDAHEDHRVGPIDVAHAGLREPRRPLDPVLALLDEKCVANDKQIPFRTS